MRITNNIITQNIISSLQQNMREIASLQQKISSGQNIHRLSDDPPSLWQVISLKERLVSQEQYHRNIEDGLLWLNEVDRSLDSANQILQKALDISLWGANVDSGTVDLQALVTETDSLINQMLDVVNTPLGERYVFAGYHKGEKPFLRQGTETGEEIVFNPALSEEALGTTIREILPQTSEEVSFNGKELFIDSNLFAHLFDLKNALEKKDTTVIRDCMVNLTADQDLILQTRATTGAKANRLNLVKETLATQETNLQESLSSLQSADITITVTELASRMLTYQASLASATKVLQMSLVNFLR